MNPIAYTYEASEHCPGCAFERFGQDDHGYVPEDAIDGEGNTIGAVAPWDAFEDRGMTCGTCGAVITDDPEPVVLTYYIITTAFGPYMPDPESNHVFEATGNPVFGAAEDGGHHVPQVLRYLRDEIESFADMQDDYSDAARWDRVLADVERDIENAANFDDAGFAYLMPDGYVIEATKVTRQQLVDYGYVPGVDFDDCGE